MKVLPKHPNPTRQIPVEVEDFPNRDLHNCELEALPSSKLTYSSLFISCALLFPHLF